jgi:hypothetical protein
VVVSLRALFLIVPVLVLALAFSYAPHPASAAASRGDADCSGTTTGTDALDVLTTISGIETTVPQGCKAVGSPMSGAVLGDADCDGEITLADVTTTLQLVAGVPVPPCYLATLATKRGVASVIGPDGGTLSTTALDGSTYQLTVPEGALTGNEVIEMTPLTDVSGLPFDDFVAGVDLQPSGLLFWTPVTLTITPAHNVSLEQETPFEISDHVLSLAPVLPQSGPVTLSLMHFTTGGIGSGTSAQRSAITGETPANVYENEVARTTQDARRGDAPITNLMGTAESYYTNQIAPNLEHAANDCTFGRTFLVKALSWARQLLVLGAGDSYATQVSNVMQSYVNNLVSCFNDAATRCQQHDLTGVTDMLTYARMLAVLGAGGSVDETKADKCAHFRLEFDSAFCLDYHDENGCFYSVHFAAPSIEWGGVLQSQPAGQGPLNFVSATGQSGGQCGSWNVTSSGSTFNIVSGGVHLNQRDEKVQSAHVSLAIQPNKPVEHWQNGCGSSDISYWYDTFCPVHSSEIVTHPEVDSFACLFDDNLNAGNAIFDIRDWTLLGGELYAEKTYDRGFSPTHLSSDDGGVIIQGGRPCCGHETTTLKLYHEPQ